MQKIDPNMFKRIEKLKKQLTANNTSLLDNLISVSLTSYNDEEIKALFGFDKVNIKYQNGVDDLTEVYTKDQNDDKVLSIK